ncbi:MAG TPA: NAD-dependent epimerase/dehydratase family protein, partial [Candidatus Kapabacteria bacterium]|nr:NAD-dependent epimerase/dehydratase family protein [Candidatus Kapabacteria bacterium]
MTFLITGGAGFIGSNLVRFALERGHEVVTVDALTYAGSEENLNGLNPDQHQFIKANITNKEAVERIIREGFHGRSFNAVINCAAETHVDRSLVL